MTTKIRYAPAGAKPASIRVPLRTYDALMAALRGVIHHNNALKPEHKISASLISEVEAAIAKVTQS